MKLINTPVEGAFIIEPEKKGDQRGYFARLFCSKLFKELGLEPECLQVNASKSAEAGTLRGMHYQLPPYAESKLLRCTQGAVYDMILDLRPESPTYKRSYGTKISHENGLMIYVPKGCAHGFITLHEETEVIYFVSSYYCQEAERGIRYNDPAFDMQWPIEPKVISAKDESHLNFNEELHHADFLQRC